jgi:hypothetical protein
MSGTRHRLIIGVLIVCFGGAWWSGALLATGGGPPQGEAATMGSTSNLSETANPPAADQESPFSQSALPANRSGRLTDEQSRVWQQVAREHRKGIRRMALPAFGIGAVLLIASGPASKAALREAVGVASLAVGAVILAAAGRRDGLTADAEEGRVESVEGAIAKHLVQLRSAGADYYLDIANHHLRTSRRGYDVTPEAGFVRAYFLPRSRRLVNLERLPDPPLPAGPDAARHVLETMAGALRTHDTVAIAEAKATAAALANAIKGASANAGSANDRHAPLRGDDLYGSWTNPLMTLTFARDGEATMTVLGGQPRAGRWSIDADGHLVTDATGRLEPVDAWLEKDQLNITVDGRTMGFTRVVHPAP